MKTFLKTCVLISSFCSLCVFGQGKPKTTTRAGSSGSAGATGQSPLYDGGVRGPNAAMGEPDMTALNLDDEEIPSKKKKPLGTIRLENSPASETLSPPKTESEVR